MAWTVCSLPGSSVHGILQVRILESVAIPFSRGFSHSRDQTQVCCIAGSFFTIWATRGFPGGSSGKDPTCQWGDVRDMGSVPGLGRSPGGGHGNPLQYSCLENPMDRGVWQAAAHSVTKSDMTEHTHTHTHTHTHSSLFSQSLAKVWAFIHYGRFQRLVEVLRLVNIMNLIWIICFDFLLNHQSRLQRIYMNGYSFFKFPIFHGDEHLVW